MSEFQGTIGRTLADSEPHWMEPPHPGSDAPNVVIVLLDDTGFAQLGCYGSDIDTSNKTLGLAKSTSHSGLETISACA